MAQQQAWEREYQKPQLIKTGDEPRADVKNYLKWLRKTESVNIYDLTALDLGSGTGKHANYLAELGNKVAGIELAPTALRMSQDRAKKLGVTVDYRLGSIGEPYPFPDHAFDLVIDVMSSNSLNERERVIYLEEVERVLKPGGHFFVRALCKDGDKNTKNLLAKNPGTEYDTYINKDMNLIERVFSETDFKKMYGEKFIIQELAKKTNYAEFNGQHYKRNYWLAYLKKK